MDLETAVAHIDAIRQPDRTDTPTETMLREGYTFSVSLEQPEGWWSA